MWRAALVTTFPVSGLAALWSGAKSLVSQASEQLGDGCPQRLGNFPQRLDGHGFVASLHLADIDGMKVGLFGEFLLAESGTSPA